MKKNILSIQSPFGPPIELSQFIWEGTRLKTNISIVSGVQGNHLNGIYICSRLIRFLNLVESRQELGYYLKGVIKIIPTVNIPAIEEDKSLWSLHDLDINLAFPGNNQGEVTEQIAASVYRHTKNSKFGVILQSANIHYDDAPQLLCLKPDGLTKDFARSLGPKNAREPNVSSTFGLSLYSQWVDQMMTSAIFSAGKPNHLDLALCETILTGIINSLLWTEVLGNDYKKPIKNQLKFNKPDKEQFITSHAGGFFLPIAKLGTEITKGQKIGDVVDIHSNSILETVLANSDGYLVTLRNHPIVYQKEILAILLRKSKLPFWPTK
jgi:predicted deacylase